MQGLVVHPAHWFFFFEQDVSLKHCCVNFYGDTLQKHSGVDLVKRGTLPQLSNMRDCGSADCYLFLSLRS